MSLIHTSSINDIWYSIYMVVTKALPLYRIMINLHWISIILLVSMRLIVLVGDECFDIHDDDDTDGDTDDDTEHDTNDDTNDDTY